MAVATDRYAAKTKARLWRHEQKSALFPLGSVIRKGVKPLAVMLHHTPNARARRKQLTISRARRVQRAVVVAPSRGANHTPKTHTKKTLFNVPAGNVSQKNHTSFYKHERKQRAATQAASYLLSSRRNIYPTQYNK